jgi:DNA-binding CsgD family transcriptional regulator
MEGLTNPEIAARLYIARRTVATHLEHIYQKTGLPNRTALAVAARQRQA